MKKLYIIYTIVILFVLISMNSIENALFYILPSFVYVFYIFGKHYSERMLDIENAVTFLNSKVDYLSENLSHRCHEQRCLEQRVKELEGIVQQFTKIT